MTDDVARIADAVLYEGYLLWPYRRSALKNQRRWTFGGVYPEAHHAGRDDDPCEMRTECLLEAGRGVTVDVRVRFLHIVARQVARATPRGLEPVDELTVGGRRHVSWDEATEREVRCGPLGRDGLLAGRRVAVHVPGGVREEALCEDGGRRAGALVRRWERLEGSVVVSADDVGDGLLALAVTIRNASPWVGGPREAALRRTFCSTHTVLHAEHGRFVSLTDPPAALREAAEDCSNQGTWPVLVGAPGERHTLLSSPIILEDHPRVAPESPGDLFDGAEIDGLLTLGILALTDAEKAEMRAADPRARAILERTEGLTDDERLALHGTMRDLRAVRER